MRLTPSQEDAAHCRVLVVLACLVGVTACGEPLNPPTQPVDSSGAGSGNGPDTGPPEVRCSVLAGPIDAGTVVVGQVNVCRGGSVCFRYVDSGT
jgi:hypothetical protein